MAQLSPNALRVLEARYLRRDGDRRVIETPDELFHRVARAVAQAELLLGSAREADRWEDAFTELLTSLEFLPNSPTLMNAGTPLGQLSACFVLPVDDTMESIFGALGAMALLQRAGGGTGFSFSHLRPRGDVVHSTGGEASGPVSFMRIFDCATQNIKQGDEILATGSARDLTGIPDAVRRLFVTATEVAVSQHLRIQQAFQRHADNAVSKTINLAEDAGEAEVARAYVDGWRLGLKGVTIYRSGSKPGQVLTIGLGEDPAAREFFTKCDPGACRL